MDDCKIIRYDTHLTPENFSPSKHTHIAQILGAVPEDVKAKLMEWKKKDH